MNFFATKYQISMGKSWLDCTRDTYGVFIGRKRVLVQDGRGPDGWSVHKEE